MTPIQRDPRIAASEARADSPQTTNPADQSSATIMDAIPKEGTPEHSQYVLHLLEKIRELEQQSATSGLPRTLGLRVSPKGGVSVYGLNANFPVTLYPEQWVRLFDSDNQQRILDFIDANKDVLEYKSEDDETRQRKEDTRRKAGIVPRQPLRNVPKAA